MKKFIDSDATSLRQLMGELWKAIDTLAGTESTSAIEEIVEKIRQFVMAGCDINDENSLFAAIGHTGNQDIAL
ncbi:hypothetical protein IQ241_24615 [Romeria aff. gracilis LEGE 07310]|uniref:Uncharacterized protein n=1 Tax=Vasconcelosia minhoensis LEGE 07310 TaxID=915328 RepID=A0A8J7ATQ9_9CYAN|nr:hypothetical protein [Romeria gracilis]MBE9080430.1 hypothetical protein [Romeria aff. gracilis LEGE 07310]